MNGWELRKEESWEWKPINLEDLSGDRSDRALYKPQKELDFILRKLRSFKGPRHVTDMTKFLFWNAHSGCRLASPEGVGPVSQHLK